MTPLPPAPSLHHILETALYADDLETTAIFYREVMGLQEIARVTNRHVFFQMDQSILLLFNPDATETGTSDPRLPVPFHGARGPGHLCFSVPRKDLEHWRKRLDAAGIPIEADFEWPNKARSLYFRDPAGNSVELAEPGLWFDGPDMANMRE